MKPRPTDKEDMGREQRRFGADVDYDTLENKKRILTFLTTTPASYLGEIAWETGLSEYTAKLVVNILRRESHIEQVPVNFDHPDQRLLFRVPDQSAINQGGYLSFSRKKWFSITPEGREMLIGEL
jgi:hypothetical protein